MTLDSATDLEGTCIDALRLLAVDMVEAASSGHPGLPLGAAHLAHVIFTRHLTYCPTDPAWPDRDRFVLSAGHGSALLYAMLHLTGHDLPLEELKRFRQWGSRTPGHPEVHLTPGVETTTGPLGQGFGNAVGMAIAERYLAERFNRPGHDVIDHGVVALVSDGDLMEGVAGEAASLAGHLRLGKLTAVYDDNDISIDGSTDLTFTEDVGARFEAMGWHVQHVDGHDVAAIDTALTAARADERPSLVVARTHIGLDSPLQDSSAVHGAAMGAENVAKLKAKLRWPSSEPFHLPADVVAFYRQAIRRGEECRDAWLGRLQAYREAHPALAGELDRALAGELPSGLAERLPRWSPEDGSIATRKASGSVIAALAPVLPELVGGSADLAGSNNTYVKDGGDFGTDPAGRNLHFGVREHAMGAAANGMALHGGIRPYVGTFLIFSDYLRPTIRLAAMGSLDVTYVLTHDSVGLGEDGPTHQPVEQLASLRAIPGLAVLRPADANETSRAWSVALARRGPVLLALSRQGLPVLEGTQTAPVERGAYVLREARGAAPDVLLIATGSEVHVALDAAELLEEGGEGAVRVVSMPSWELFAEQDEAYRESVLPPSVTARVSVEAASTFGWERWTGERGVCVGLSRFGASAPGKRALSELGFSADAVATAARKAISLARPGG